MANILKGLVQNAIKIHTYNTFVHVQAYCLWWLPWHVEIHTMLLDISVNKGGI